MRRTHLAIILALMPSASSIAGASTFIFSDHDYPDATWTIPDSILMDSSQTGQQLMGGNPGAYRQLGLIFAERPDYAANLNLTFTYTPATESAISGIIYNFDLKVINAFGSTYYPLVSQDGVLYYDPFASAYNSENVWINYNLVLDVSQFVPLHGALERRTSPRATQLHLVTWRQLEELASMNPSLGLTMIPSPSRFPQRPRLSPLQAFSGCRVYAGEYRCDWAAVSAREGVEQVLRDPVLSHNHWRCP